MTPDELKWLLPVISQAPANDLQQMEIKGALLSRFCAELRSQLAPPKTAEPSASTSHAEQP